MFHVKQAGGAGGNRTPDLCSAIETASRKSRAIPARFPIRQSGKSAPKAGFAGQFSRTIAGALRLYIASWLFLIWGAICALAGAAFALASVYGFLVAHGLLKPGALSVGAWWR